MRSIPQFFHYYLFCGYSQITGSACAISVTKKYRILLGEAGRVTHNLRFMRFEEKAW